ncbi:Hypothetical protein EPM1_3816 [Stenotrophomonas maltophilia EPM1]|nr:Hypothetical protein EPM1_3816 [Stenotrophomonas maltophilia EPM1]
MDKVGHQRERIPGRALPGTRFKPEPEQQQRQRRSWLWVARRAGGGLWVCGDAVDPSLGAWPRHPCRGHPANPQSPPSTVSR